MNFGLNVSIELSFNGKRRAGKRKIYLSGSGTTCSLFRRDEDGDDDEDEDGDDDEDEDMEMKMWR